MILLICAHSKDTAPVNVHSVCVPFMQELDKRWDARQSGLEPLTLTASVLIDSKAAGVWAFLSNPRSALLTSPHVIKAFHVPGTPEDDVGEQQCFIMNVARRLCAYLSEVVAIDAPHRLVIRWPTMATDQISTLTLTPEGSRTTVTYQLGMRVALGTRKKNEPVLRAGMEDELQRLRAGVESGARFGTS